MAIRIYRLWLVEEILRRVLSISGEGNEKKKSWASCLVRELGEN